MQKLSVTDDTNDYQPLTHMITKIFVNIGPGNGLLPDGTKPLPELNVDFTSKILCGIRPIVIS